MDRMLTRIDVEADEPESLTIRWEPPYDTEVEIGIGPTPDAAAHTPMLRVPAGESSALLTGVGPGRHYISVSHDGTRLVSAERRARFAGALNFRDLGGYPTAAGRSTGWGLLRHPGSLRRLPAHDLTAVDGLGVRAIFDLRDHEERKQD